jgi:succinate dehydrogenase / fumarate reductase cytochrome b subunit
MKVLQSFSTAIGTKILIALTGLALVGFLVLHLAGNLLLFFGPARFNGYAHSLVVNPLLVPAEVGLLLVFLVHLFKAVANYAHNRAARPVKYQKKVWAHGASRKSVGSTTMIVSGTVTLVFIVIHLATFKFGPQYPSAQVPGERDLFRLVVEVFHNPWTVVFYAACMVVIGFHLRHGISSAFQSLGLIPSAWTRVVLTTGAIVAVLIAGGFCILPLYVYFFR